MSIIEENAKTIKDWLKHLDFEHEHPGYGKDVYKKLDEIIAETQKILVLSVILITLKR